MLRSGGYLRNMSIAEIIDYSIWLYKRNFKKLFMLSLVLYIPFILLYTAVVSYMTGDMFKVTGIGSFYGSTFNNTFEAPENFLRLLAFYLVVNIMGLLYLIYCITLKPVLDASVTQIIYNDVVRGQLTEWKDAMKKSFASFGRLLLNRLLYGLILYGVAIAASMVFYLVIFAVIFIFAGTAATYMTDSNTAMFVILGILAAGLIIAVIAGAVMLAGYFAVRFGFGTQSVIIENVSASNALSRSHELTKKKFWHSGITAGIALLIVTTLPGMLSLGTYFLIFINTGLYALASSVIQVITAIIQPFLTVVLTVIFTDLKVRKEGQLIYYRG